LVLLVGCSYLVSVLRETPARFEFALSHHAGTACPDIMTLMMSSAKVRDLRRPLYDDLGFVAFSGTPSYQIVEYGPSRGQKIDIAD
jgi:hypothetical protein